MILLRRFDFLPFPLPFTNRLLPGIPKQGTSHLHAVLRVAWLNCSFELRVPQKLSGSNLLDQSAKKKKAKIGRLAGRYSLTQFYNGTRRWRRHSQSRLCGAEILRTSLESVSYRQTSGFSAGSASRAVAVRASAEIRRTHPCNLTSDLCNPIAIA